MKKNIRIFLSVMMLVVFAIGIETYAADTEAVIQDNVPSKKVSFEEMVNDQMRHTDSLLVENMEGEEITNEFIEIAQKYISEGNYDALKEYMYSTVNSVKYRVIEKELPSPLKSDSVMRAGVSKYIQDYDVRLLTDQHGHKGHIIIEVGGTYIYDRNSGQISSAYNAKVVSVDYADLGWWNVSPTNIMAYSSISSDRYTAYFTGNVTTSGYHQDVPFEECKFGTATVTISGQGGY